MTGLVFVCIFSGIISLTVSISLVFFPNLLRAWNDYFNHVLFTDDGTILYRKKTGIALLIISLILLIAFKLIG